MPFCVNCGKKLNDDVRFCNECGTEIQSSHSQSQQNQSVRTSVYDGVIHKCPNCGEIINSFETNCHTCGYEIRSVKTMSPVEDLSHRIQQAKSMEEKNELIINFYIPNTKEDIYDFFILAISNLENSMHDTDAAWKSKLEQAYQKAQLTLGNTPEFTYFQQLYDKSQKTVKANFKTNIIISLIKSGYFWAGIIALIGVSLWMIDKSSEVCMLMFVISIWVALFTAIDNDKKKKK